MAYKPNTPIPVTTVPSNDYLHPSKDKDGQWVVSASTVNMEPNKVILYNPLSRVYTPVNPNTVSPDYYEQVRNYESRMQQQMGGWADSTNPTQVNSFGDILFLGNSDFKPIRGTIKAIGQLFQGEPEEALKTWWNASDINLITDKVKGTFDLIKDFTIDPLLSDESLGHKGVQLLLNSVTNLGETMDVVTGANLIKGVIQEGVSSIPKGFNWNGEGRVQYDWNVKTGNTAADLVSNVVLEVVSDPTNWISFGAAGAMKSIGKTSLSRVISKSATDIGKTISKSQADDIAAAAVRTYIYKDTTLTHALQKSKLGLYMNEMLSPTEVSAFTDALRNNASMMSGVRTMQTLKSVRSGLDSAQQAAFKAVGYTSALGLGYHAVKESVKYGDKAISYMTHILNDISKSSGVNAMTLSDFPEHVQDVEIKLNKLKDVVTMSGDFPIETTKQVTRVFQELKYNQARNILYQKKSSEEILKAFNAFAVEQGFADGKDLFTQMQNSKSAAPDDLRRQLAELGNKYSVVYDDAVYDTVEKALSVLSPDAIDVMQPDELSAFVGSIRQVADLGITPNIDTALYSMVAAHLDARVNLNATADLRELVKVTDGLDLKMLRRGGVFSIGTLVDGKFKPVADSAIEALRIAKQPLTSLVVNLHNVYVDVYIKELTAVEAQLSNNFTLNALIGQEVDEILTILTSWKNNPRAVTTAQAVYANRAWASISRKIAQVHAAVNVDEEIRLNSIVQSTQGAVDILSKQLQMFVEDYNATFTQEASANVYTDIILDKAAHNTTHAVVKDTVAHLAFQKGVSPEDNAKMFVQLTNFNPDKILSKKDVDVKAAFGELRTLAKAFKDAYTSSYFIDELGLNVVIDDWAANGFSADLGSKLLRSLDDAITHMLHPTGTSAAQYTDAVFTVQSFRDKIQDLVDRLSETEAQRVKITAELLSTKLYAAKLTHVQAISWLLSMKSVQSTLTEIRLGVGLGQLAEVLADKTYKAPTANAVSVIQGLSKSMYVSNRMFELIRDSKLGDDWKNGMYDSVAGIIRSHMSEIYTPEYTAATLLNSSKEFIDRSKGAHSSMMFSLTNTGDPLEAATNLYNALFTAAPFAGETVKIKSGNGKVRYDIQSIERSQQKHWDIVASRLALDYKDTFNVVYSASPTGYQTGTLFEIAHVLPNGETVKYVDASMRDTVIRTIDETTARKVWGKSKAEVIADIQARAVRDASDPRVKVLNTTEEFAIAEYEFFKNVKSTARQYGLTPRLVGFNNASDSFATDKILAHFLDTNKTNTHIVYNDVDYKSMMTIRSFDAAQWLRVKYERAVTITDTMQKEVTEIVRKTKEFLDRANVNTEYGVAQIMPDFNSEVTTAFRELLAAVQNAMDIKLSPSTARFKDITKEQYTALNHSFTFKELEDFKVKLSNSLDDIGGVLSMIKNTNSVLGQHLMLQQAVAKFLGEKNVMNILHKHLAGSNGMSPYSYKKVFDPAIFNEWFDLDYVTKVGMVEDLSTVVKMNAIAERLQKQRNRITHPLLIMDIPQSSFKDVIMELRNTFIALPNYKYSEWAKEVLMLNVGDNSVNNFLIAKLLYDSIVKVSDVPTINRVYAEASKLDDLLMSYIKAPDISVFYKDALYVPGLRVLHSELIEADNYIMQLTKDIQTVTRNSWKMETLYDALALNLKSKEETGISLPSIEIKQQFLEAYRNLITNVQRDIDAAFRWVQTQTPANADARKYVRQLYTDRIKQIISEMDDVTVTHSLDRAKFIMNMRTGDYTPFLYKYSQGIQMFDMASEVIQGDAQLSANFMYMLKDAEQYGVRYYEDLVKHQLFVYLDKSVVDLKALDNRAKNFTLTHAPIAPKSGVQADFAKFSNLMDTHFDGAYGMSMHRVMDMKKYKELVASLPNEILDRIIPISYLDEHDLIDGVFMQSIVGDYASGVGSIFTTHSGNLITNTAAGFNVAYNRLQGKDLYVSAMFGRENSLQSWVLHVNKFYKVDQADLASIHELPYVIAELKDGRVNKLDIRTQAQFQAALDSNAVILDYQSYARAIEVINDNNISPKWYHWINKNYMGALKSGMLLSTGFLFRNIVDSTLKGWVQAGLDPAFIGMIPETRRIMTQYQKTYSEVFLGTEGNMTPANVKAYIANLSNKFDMNPELFTSLLTFYNNTASVPTPVQMQLTSNLAHKLYLRVKSDARIRESDVEYVLDIFKTTMKSDAPYTNALKQIRAKYGEAMAEKFMLLRKYVPKEELSAPWYTKVIEEIPTLDWLMKQNNSVETFIRTHVFLHHSYFTAGSISEGIEMTDKSQFNRARDNKQKKILEFFLPFSSFQMDNFFFWSDTAIHSKNNLLALAEDVMSGAYDEEEIDIEELSRNMSLQYLYMSGNLILDDETGEVLKLNDSVHNTLQLITNPIGTVSNMLNVPLEVLTTMLTAINADEAAYDEDSFNNPKPISRWTPEEYSLELTQLIPLVGVLYQRYHTAIDKLNISDAVMPLLIPSLFGVAKLDSNVPIGYDWYDQTEEYKKEHRYVYGVSYVPAWMKKNPETYVNTYQRLLAMGYTEQTAATMMQTGWYIRYSSYELAHYEEYTPKMPYAPRVYTPYFKRTYPKYAKRIRKQRKVYFKRNRSIAYSADRVRVTRFNMRRVYKTRMYSDLYTRTGVPRENLINWRGANRSSRQLLIDRSNARRKRTQRIIRQVRGK